MPQGALWNLIKGFILLSAIFVSGTINAQHPPAPDEVPPLPVQNSTLNTDTRPESDCGNGIDDNNNGLTDLKDFHCYFSGETSMEECRPTKILWASSNWGIHWIDLETKQEKLVMRRHDRERTYDDLAWGSNGKLYGTNRHGGIFEIDPHSYSQTLIGDVDGYYYSNGMTGDAAGNIYLTSLTKSGEHHVVRFNIATRKTYFVVSLSNKGLKSAGDLCFVNGHLYISCLNNIIAKINIATGGIEKLKIINSPVSDGSYGMTSLGDGYLYISNNREKIYRVDPNAMRAEYFAGFKQHNFITLGFASYTDLCNAPGCRGKVTITTDRFPPYCASDGVVITAKGRGIKGNSGYVWTLPNGSTAPGNTLTAREKGTYYVRYHTLPDTCGIVDSIVLNITARPSADLGNDTFVCINRPMTLHPKVLDDATAYYWDDGSTGPSRTISMPGKYWIEATNRCGVSSDTILVTTKTKSPVFIGNDTMICPKNSIIIHNDLPRDRFTIYTWSTGVMGDAISVKEPGLYWLESTNACGTLRDEILIQGKDSCICEPFLPSIDAGRDRWLCTYDTLMLSNALHDDGFRYTWSIGSQDKAVVIKAPGTYTVSVSTYCGTVSDTVIVHPKVDECECFLYVPNAFSPNHDGKNDAFGIRSNCVIKGRIRIFNRWGGEVYSSDNINRGWNGTSGNKTQPSGTYIYDVHYEYVNRPGKFLKRGTLTLVR